MDKKRLGFYLILLGVFAVDLLSVNSALGSDCAREKQRLATAEGRLRQGGNANYMNRWRANRSRAEDALRSCRSAEGSGMTRVVGARKHPVSKVRVEKLIASQLEDPQLQKLIATCNYWIAQYNNSPSPENQAFKENACRDARTLEANLRNPPQAPVVINQKRSLADCIKPGNVIDNQVSECMQGLRTKTW